MRNMRAPSRTIVIFVAALSLFAAACGSGAEPGGQATDGAGAGTPAGEGEEPVAAGDTIQLRFSSYIGESAPQSRSMQWWADEVSSRTDGRVEVEFFYQGAILGPTESLTGITEGRADVGYTAEAYFPSQLPLSTAVEIPFITSDAAAQAKALTQLYEENQALRDEWESQGVHVLYYPALSGNILGSKEPVESLDDIRGKSIRGLGLISNALSAIGADPVTLGSNEIYESLQRGVIEAYSGFAFEVVTALKLHEVAPHVVGTGMGQYVAPIMVMNKSTYEGLPDDVRQVVDEVSAEALDESIRLLVEVEDEVCQTILDAGGTVGVLPDEDIEEWRSQVADQLRQQWLDDHADVEGAEEFLQAYVDAVAEWEEQTDYTPGVRRCAQQG